jgi:predicted Rossmann fold nucleotide-binding protein DprA/Smf involved in DNA uptake
VPARIESIASVSHSGLAFSVLGNAELLKWPLLALFCSIRCPGKLILQCYDAARALRDASVPVISGFHTPMERECLDFLLKGRQPLVICPARTLHGMRLPAPWRAGIDSGRLAVASPFAANIRRARADTAVHSNRFVAALASEVLVVYAAAGGKTESLCRLIAASGKPLFTFDSPENGHLTALGARAITIEALVRRRQVTAHDSAFPVADRGGTVAD